MAAQPATARPGRQPQRGGKTNDAGCRTFLPGAAGLGIAIVLLALGSMLRADAKLADENVAQQLAEQRITFKTVDALSAEERLTSFGFDTLGDRAALGATVAFTAGGLVLLLSAVLLLRKKTPSPPTRAAAPAALVAIRRPEMARTAGPNGSR